MCVYVCVQINQNFRKSLWGRIPVLTLSKLYESIYHFSELEFSQRPAEVAGNQQYSEAGEVQTTTRTSNPSQGDSEAWVQVHYPPTPFPQVPQHVFPSPTESQQEPWQHQVPQPLFQWDRESDMVSRPFAPLWKVVKGEFTWDPQTGHIVSCRTTDKAPI